MKIALTLNQANDYFLEHTDITVVCVKNGRQEAVTKYEDAVKFFEHIDDIDEGFDWD